MRIDVLITPTCPHTAEALRRLRRVLDSVGLSDASFTVRMIRTPDEAHSTDFHGSPSFQVDGKDLFPHDPGAPPLECRAYHDGTAHLPELNQLRDAIQTADPLI